MSISFVDIHCHLLPGIDDGAKSWDDAVAMARLAADDGTTTIIATPHQLGNFSRNRGDEIRNLAGEMQRRLEDAQVPIRVLPGADVRIEPEMVKRIQSGEVLTLGDHRRHVLLELPHELYFPIDAVLTELARGRLVGILSHPERNEGILRQPGVLAPLVEAGCLMQITAGSLGGSFGPACREFAEWMLSEGLVHFAATDGHGPRSRRPLMGRAFERVRQLTNEETATDLCARNPARVAEGKVVPNGRRAVVRCKRRWWARPQVALSQ
jgi:protein-tyrosine phosphatase